MRLAPLFACAMLLPGMAHAQDAPLPDEPWDAHAAAAVLDASFATPDACEAKLAEARAAESTPAADIDPRLRDMFTHAQCRAVNGADGPSYAMRLSWPEDEEPTG